MLVYQRVSPPHTAPLRCNSICAEDPGSDFVVNGWYDSKCFTDRHKYKKADGILPHFIVLCVGRVLSKQSGSKNTI